MFIRFKINAKAVGWNEYMRMHHFARYEIVNEWKLLVRMALRKNSIPRKLLKHPVSIQITAVQQKPYDPDNICDKLVIDGLKGEILKDDSYKHVQSVCTVSEKGPWAYVDIIIIVHDHAPL